MKQPWQNEDPFHRWSRFEADSFGSWLRSSRPQAVPGPESLASVFCCAMLARQSRFDSARRGAAAHWLVSARRCHGQGAQPVTAGGGAS